MFQSMMLKPGVDLDWRPLADRRRRIMQRLKLNSADSRHLWIHSGSLGHINWHIDEKLLDHNYVKAV